MFAAIVAALFYLGGAIGWLVVVGLIRWVSRGRVLDFAGLAEAGCGVSWVEGAVWLGAALSFYGNFPEVS